MPWYVQCGWDDVPHIPDAEKERLLASIAPYQRDARSKGIPRLGAGAIYPIAEDQITCPPVDIRAIQSWVMHGYGMDVGWNATAACRGIWDRGTDIITIVDEYQRAHAEPATHVASINRWGKIKGAIDPASRGRGQRDGKRLFRDYQKAGLLLKEAENAVEAGIYEVWTRLVDGRLKIATNCVLLLQALSMYHRNDDGKVVKVNDHLCDALRYLVMTPTVFALLPGQQHTMTVLGQGGKRHVRSVR